MPQTTLIARNTIVFFTFLKFLVLNGVRFGNDLKGRRPLPRPRSLHMNLMILGEWDEGTRGHDVVLHKGWKKAAKKIDHRITGLIIVALLPG